MLEKTKLTLRVDGRWVPGAKAFARRRNTSLSQLVSAYLQRLAIAGEAHADAHALSELTGVLPAHAGQDAYREIVERKHGG